MSPTAVPVIPEKQTAARVPKLGGGVVFEHNYPVPKAGHNEVLAKVLYSGVCQSGEFPANTRKPYIQTPASKQANNRLEIPQEGQQQQQQQQQLLMTD
jgi:hypothetical protein